MYILNLVHVRIKKISSRSAESLMDINKIYNLLYYNNLLLDLYHLKLINYKHFTQYMFMNIIITESQ